MRLEGEHMPSNHFVVISGCSSSGKSTLLTELSERGYATVEEPGRRIVREELRGDGHALPWMDGTAFARRAVTVAVADLAEAGNLDGWVFFDRGVIDGAAALQHLTGEPMLMIAQKYRYHERVFMGPPWPEIYVTDAERHHSFDTAVAEYQRLLEVYSSLGYDATILPKVSVSERANFVLSRLF
jgi:predicted ATPase